MAKSPGKPAKPKRAAAPSPSPLSPAEAADLSRRLDASDRAASLGDLTAALAALEGASAPQAATPQLRAQRATLLARHIGEPDKLAEAEKLFRRLHSEIRAPHPIFANFGNLLKLIGKLDQAETMLSAVAAAHPQTPGIFGSLAAVHYEQGEWTKEREAYQAALRQNPEDAKAREGLGYVALGLGDFESGWPLYELRGAKAREQESADPPLWTGAEPLDGPILLWREQGLGEQILFAALAPELAARGERATLLVDPRLAALFARSLDGVQILSAEQAADLDTAEFRRQGPIAALGRALRPRLASFPAPPPARLVADPDRVAEMRAWLAQLGDKPKIGLSWRSELVSADEAARPSDDVVRRQKRSRRKTVPLKEWGPFLKDRDAVFVDLQYGDTDAERAEAHRRFGVDIASHPALDRTEDIDGLAALITALDGVATISNTTAHLAGALGQRTLLILNKSHLWYWGFQGRRDCLWYPGIEIFRRRRSGLDGDGWSQTMRDAARRMRAWFAAS